ncbi:MAG: NAD(P) transhydrogenase subunit alpha [bacterium]|nr:NAD(P) transhydrogenase subunit alpha [bacterium]
MAVLVLLLIPVQLFSLEEESKEQGKKETIAEYSAPAILGFTRHLISKKEYYRASLELQRLNSFYPGFISPIQFRVTESYLQFQGAQYKHILKHSSYMGPELLFKTDAALVLQDYSQADRLLSSWNYGNDPLFDLYFIKRRFFRSLAANPGIEPAEDFSKIFQGEEFRKYRELIAYSHEQYDMLKKPVAAFFLGLLPGMGYVYAGNKNTGIVALIAISITGALSYFAFSTNNEPIGIFVGAIGTFFYTGSIVGGYMETQRYNRRIMERRSRYLAEQMNFDEDRESIFRSRGIGTGELNR